MGREITRSGRAQFSLRVLCVAVAVIGVCLVPFAYVLQGNRVRRAIIAEWRRQGVAVHYTDHKCGHGWAESCVGRLVDLSPSELDAISFRGNASDSSDVSRLRYFSVRRIEIDGVALDSAAIDAIAEQEMLEELFLARCDVQVAELLSAARSRRIRVVSIKEQTIRNEDMEVLQKLPALVICDVDVRGVSVERIEQFLMRTSSQIVRVSCGAVSAKDEARWRRAFRNKTLFVE